MHEIINAFESTLLAWMGKRLTGPCYMPGNNYYSRKGWPNIGMGWPNKTVDRTVRSSLITISTLSSYLQQGTIGEPYYLQAVDRKAR